MGQDREGSGHARGLMGCVVGLGGRDLDRSGAERAIAGYTILNDVSARDRWLLK